MFQYHKINASQYDIIAPGDMRIAIAGTEKDARRIVACLNALTELDTEYIEKMEIRNVPPINTRLLETLKDIVFVVEVTEQQQGKQLLDLINTAREVIDEAEAKCNTPERQALQHYGKGMAKMLNKALTDDPSDLARDYNDAQDYADQPTPYDS